MRPIDADHLQEAMKNVTDDPTCPIHIAATIDQIIDCAPTVDDWIPCRERMPENETEVLIFCPDFCERIKKAVFIEDGFYEERSDLIVKPGEYCTHWMPLPEPPKEVQHVD